MILQRVVEYDRKFGEGLPPGYRRLPVHHILRLNAQGELRDVIPVMAQEGKKTVGRYLPVPDLKRSGSAPGALLFVDLAKYVLARGAPDDAKDYSPYRERFLDLARACADQADDPRIKVAFQFLRGLDLEDGRFAAVEPDHRLYIEVDGNAVAELPEVQSFWASYVRQKTGAKSGQARARCLVTGEACEPVRIFSQKVVGVPNTNNGRADLISFNNEAFCSYGLEQTANSPISPEAAEGITRGLNHLIGAENHRIRVGPVLYVAWCREKQELAPWRILENPLPEHVSQLLESPISGRKAPSTQSSNFYVLSLSGANSRIVVRDYHETTLEAVRASLGRWFQRLELVGIDGEPLPPAGIYRLAASLYPDENKEMPAHVPNALVASAITGRPLPDYLLGLAVKRNLAMQGPFRLNRAKARVIDESRLRLLKALLTRSPEDDSLSALDPNHSSPAYHCGRLLAVLESIQRAAALPSKLNATLVDRYYGSVATRPATMLGGLIKTATSAHLPKLRKNRRSAYNALDERLRSITEQLGAGIPRNLALHDQAIFALGYYHQKAHDIAEVIKNKELKELAEIDASESEDHAE